MTRTPAPGRPVRGSRTGRPIMATLDLLGRRWALRIIWEFREGRLTFRALQGACGGVSPNVLNARLRELRESGLIDLVDGEGYGLTPLGRDLRVALRPLTEWSERWARTSSPFTPAARSRGSAAPPAAR
ncbi:MAG: helix-turn-helix transcriptional regulator [Candidatus Rokubacteria bacterium]|nr:helix-turn-helix transcriptional regulator [Candidatus Rokubacteria bacterium]